jgi:hypothetical protein
MSGQHVKRGMRGVGGCDVVDMADEGRGGGGRAGEAGSGGGKTKGEAETAAKSKSRFHNVE